MGRPARYRFEDAGGLALWSRIGLYLCAGLALLTAASSWMHLNLLEGIRSGAVEIIESEEDLNVRDLSELREVIVGMTLVIAYIAAVILTSMWTYRANANLRALTEKVLDFTPGWAVGWYFVPIASLWMPFRMMSELWRRSAEDIEPPGRRPWYLLAWWLSFNAMVLADRAASRMYLRADTMEEEISAQRVDIAGSLLTIPAALLFAKLIRRIQAMHAAELERKRAEGVTDPVQDSPWR